VTYATGGLYTGIGASGSGNGGGCSANVTGLAGGSGVVIIRYLHL
jgi:hypothetical protein